MAGIHHQIVADTININPLDQEDLGHLHQEEEESNPPIDQLELTILVMMTLTVGVAAAEEMINLLLGVVETVENVVDLELVTHILMMILVIMMIIEAEGGRVIVEKGKAHVAAADRMMMIVIVRMIEDMQNGVKKEEPT